MNRGLCFLAGMICGVLCAGISASTNMFELRKAHATEVQQLRSEALPVELREQVKRMQQLALPILERAVTPRARVVPVETKDELGTLIASLEE